VINAIVFDFSSTSRVMALNMLRLDAKFGVFRPSFFRGHFQELGIAALPMGLKPRHVEKFPECRFDERQRKCANRWKRNMRKTCDCVRRTGYLNNVQTIIYNCCWLWQCLNKGFEGPAFGPKMAEENKREFTEDQLRAGRQGHIGLQAGSNKGATQSGINMGKPRSVHD